MTHLLTLLFAASLLAPAAQAEIYELRTYTAAEGKLPQLVARFRNHTVKLFVKHGMKNVGYWVPQDAPGSQNTLVYLLAHKDRASAQKNWEAFRNDPEWIRVRDQSEANGKLVLNIVSVFLNPTDFSPLK